MIEHYHRHPEDVEQHHGPTFRDYMIVFAALCVFTATSFIVNALVARGILSPMAGLAIIMAVAVVKATLVALYFMHLKWDWGKIFFLMIPVMILTVMMVIVLLPDVVQSDLDQTGPPGSGVRHVIGGEAHGASH